MWPKAFAQLVELAPHISRLLPMADRFFQSKSTTDDANRIAMEANRKALETNRAAMAAMAEGLRSDLGEMTAANAGLHEQILATTAALGEVVADGKATRLAAESVEHRLSAMEARQSRISLFFSIILLLLVAICILLILIYAHAR